jgi:hypothetical protein
MAALRCFRFVLFGGALLLVGCSLGPTAIRINELRYNKAIADTENEQFLLNLVRLRYRDPPKALAIASVNSAFSFDATGPFAFLVGNTEAGANAALTHLYNILAFQSHVADVPTISMSPLGGGDFVTGLVAPIPFDRIATLANTGWDLERLLRIMVHSMNGVENAPHLAGGGGERAPRFQEFVAVAKTLTRLHNEGLLDISVNPLLVPGPALSEPLIFESKLDADKRKLAEDKQKLCEEKAKEAGKEDEQKEERQKKLKEQEQKLAETEKCLAERLKQEEGKVPPSHITPGDLLNAAGKNYIFHEIGNTVVLKSTIPIHEMSVAPPAWDNCELVEAAHILHLVPNAFCYRLLPADGCLRKLQLAHPGTDIEVGTRSTLSAMLYLSRGIDVPEEHYKQGLVAVPTDESGNPADTAEVTEGIFHVLVQKKKPKHSFVAVKYRGYWFYIADNDLSSKSSFDLILETFNVQITRGQVTSPVLTLPVGAGAGASGRRGGGGG